MVCVFIWVATAHKTLRPCSLRADLVVVNCSRVAWLRLILEKKHTSQHDSIPPPPLAIAMPRCAPNAPPAVYQVSSARVCEHSISLPPVSCMLQASEWAVCTLEVTYSVISGC